MNTVYRFLFILFLIFLFLAEFFHPITAINVDLGRHLLLGDIIAKTHHVPDTNLLSYTFTDFPYSNTSWLTEVIYHYLYVLGGYNLLLIVNTFFIAFAFGLLVYYVIKKNGLTPVTLFCITLYLLLLGLRPDIRPEVISMVCMSLFFFILYCYRDRKNKILFFLIPIEMLWVNSHIYFFVGPLLLLLFLIADLIENNFLFSKAKTYLVVIVGVLFSTLLNPQGFKGAVYPFFVVHNYGFPVAENQSLMTLFTIYHSSEIMLPVLAIILLFIILFFTRKNTKPIDWLLAIVFSLATFFAFRNILLFVFATFVIFTTQMHFLEMKYRPFLKKIPRLSYFYIYPISLLLLILLLVSCIEKTGFGFGVKEQSKGAVDFLISQKIKGPFYNNFDIGGYLAYRIYPQLVFVDNRPEAYPASFFQNVYLPMQNNPQIFNKLDKTYHFNSLVISYWDNTPWGSNLLRYLVNDSDFKLVYLDSYTTVLVRDTSENKLLIPRNLIMRKNDKYYFQINQQSLIHYLFFFEKVGWKEKVSEVLILLRKKDLELCLLMHYPIEKTSINSFVSKHGLGRNCYLK